MCLLDITAGADQKGEGSKRADVVKKSNGQRDHFLGRIIIFVQESEHSGFKAQEREWPTRKGAWRGHHGEMQHGQVTQNLEKWARNLRFNVVGRRKHSRFLGRRVKFLLSH